MSSGLSLVSTEATIERPGDLSPRKLWELEIEAASKAMKKFVDRAKIANDRFLDDRDTINADMRWFNIYYANTVILESSLYADLPEPSVCRRYEDYQDQVARVAALILQRSLKQDINDPEDSFDATMRQCVQDRLIPGMACAWLRFETETEAIPTSEGGTLTNAAQSTQPHATSGGYHDDGFTVPATESVGGNPVSLMHITDQSVIVDYVHWQDFLFSPCRTWEERRWVARRVFMTRDQLTKRFGAAKAKLCQLDHNVLKDEHSVSGSLLHKDVFQKAVVWEIWDRTTRKVHWYAPGYANDLLDTRSDFLRLQSFEPCPRPMLANITTTSTVPRPDYYMIQDQYTELNAVNARISLLVQACKVVGVYDQSAAAVGAILQGNENTMVPVPNWGQFSEKGGMKGAVDWIPLEMVVVALQRLYEARDAIKGQIYELTGIADIVRGESKASETLGAQKIKAQFASIRIKKLQGEVAAFASDILRIKGEMQAKHYEPATLIRKSGIFYTDNHDWVVDAILLLKSEKGFNWRIEVQADSMAQADYEAEKKDRIEFMSMATGYLAQALPIAGQIPELKPAIFGMLKWAIASFKGASDIEGMIDRQLSELEGKPPPQPKPDPKVEALQMKTQADMQGKQMDAQIKQKESDQKMQLEQGKAQLEAQKQQAQLAFEQQKFELDRQMKEMDLQFKRQELALKGQEQQQNLQAGIQKSQIDLQTHQQVAQQKVQDSMVQSDIARQRGEQELQQAEERHDQEQRQAAAKPEKE